MKEKEARMLIHAAYSKCLKCQKRFRVKEEIVLLKNSNVMHKSCYEKVMEEVSKE
jgi:hypothetical protein